MAGVDADPTELESFATQLTKLQQDLEDQVKRTQGAFARLRWNDSERRKFQDTLEQALRSVRSAASALDPLPKVLRKKATHLRDFQR